jgi:hypothetical protein
MIENKIACDKVRYLVDSLNVIMIQDIIANDAIKFRCDNANCPDNCHAVNYNKEEYIFEDITSSKYIKSKMYKIIDVMHVCWTSSQSEYYLLESDNIKIIDRDLHDMVFDHLQISSIIDSVYCEIIASDHDFHSKYSFVYEKYGYNFNIIVEFNLADKSS